MTDALPPDAVEAALWAIVDARGYGGIDDMSQTGETRSVLDSSIQYATAALLAAQPAWEAWLREKVATEIEEHDHGLYTTNGYGKPYIDGFENGLTQAARICREGGTP